MNSQWNTTTPNWILDSTGGTTNYIDGNPIGGDIVVFDDGAGSRSTVNIASNVQPSSVTFNNTASSYVLQGTGGIAGATALNVNGAGLVTICDSNTYTGPTAINGGTLQLGNGQSGQDGSINGTSGVTNNSTLVYNIAGNQTIPYAIGGSGNVLFTGTGLATLTGSSSYSGTTTISAGTLQVGNGGPGAAAALSSASAVTDNATLIFSSSMSGGTAQLPAAGIAGTGTVAAIASNIMFNGNVTTGGSQSYTAGTGGAAFSNGGNVGGTVSGTTITLATTGAGAGISLTGDFGTSAGAFTNYLVVDTSAGNGPINLNISLGRVNVWDRLAFFTANAGTGAINWSGTDGLGGYGVTGYYGNQGFVTLIGGSINISSSLAANSINTMVLTLEPSTPSSVSGELIGTIALVAAGSSTVTLSSTAGNVYTGSTTVQSGVLQLGNSGSLGYSGTAVGGLAVNGGTLDLAGNSVTAYSFSGVAGTVTSSATGAATLTVSQSTATSFGGAINDGAGKLSLVLNGLGGNYGSLTLGGTDGYSGGTTVVGGELIATDNEALADGSSLFVGSAFLNGSPFGTIVSATGLPGAAQPTAIAPVPEPGTLTLLTTGALAAGWGAWQAPSERENGNKVPNVEN